MAEQLRRAVPPPSSPLQTRATNRRLIVVGCVALIATFLGSLAIGRYAIGPVRVAAVLVETVRGLQSAEAERFGTADRAIAPISDTERAVVVAVRLPRVATAMMVGAALAISGAALQGLFRNPLISPGILGVSSGAGLGASLAILIVGYRSWLVQAAAFAFGMGAVVLTLFMAGRASRRSILVMVLSGVIVAALAEALISLVKFVADPEDTLPAIVYWLMGSLAGSTTDSLVRIAPPIVVGATLLLLLRWRINVLSLGDTEARSLGVNVTFNRWLVVGAAAMTTAAAVSIAGVVGWVGLVVPHMSRMIVGPDHRRLLPTCAVLGAVYVTLIDTLARTLTSAEVPLGILTAIVGAPVFAALLRKTGGAW